MAEHLSKYRVTFKTGIQLDLVAPNELRAREIAEQQYPQNRIVEVEWMATRPNIKRRKAT